MHMKIKTGDNVQVLHGKDRGKTGKVIQVLRDKQTNTVKVVVEGVNKLKKHLRSRGGEQGRTIELPAPIDVSNVMLLDPSTSKATRVGFSKEGDKKVRVAKGSGKTIE